MIGSSVRHLVERKRARFKWISGFEIGDAGATLTRQNRGRNPIDARSTDKWIVQPLCNFVAERDDIQKRSSLRVSQGSRLYVGSVNPCFCRGSRPRLRSVESQDATIQDQPIGAEEHVIGREDWQFSRRITRKQCR